MRQRKEYKGKCWSCYAQFDPYVCLRCLGPEIDLACKECHDETRHGIVAKKPIMPLHLCSGPACRDENSPSNDNAQRAREDGV